MTMCIRTLLAGVALVPAMSIAWAAPAAAQAERQFDIAPGPLDVALIRFAAQADLQVANAADLVAGRRTAGVRGRFASRTALERLLAGTGLTWTEARPGVIVLRRFGPDRAELEAVEIEEVIVTGTLIRGPGETPSPITVISRDDLDRRGQATVAEALTQLPQAYSGSATPNSLLLGADSLGSNSAVATGVNLRGLGADATLVLVNGRRLAGTGLKGEFADLSSIPTAAVERVDVLLDGASALYGSDAVAGVVNVILRRSYEGQETRLRASAAEGGAEDLIASHLIGRRWSNGSALLSYEYQHQNALNSEDRAYTSTGDLRPFGGMDRRTFFGPPGSLVVFDAGLSAFRATFAIRPGADGVARTPADFVAGASNLSNRREGVDILPKQARQSLYANVRQSLGSAVGFTADARFTRREFSFANLTPVSFLTVTRANPFFVSPNGSASHQIAYGFGEDLGPTRSHGEARSLGLTAGFDIALPADWTLDLYAAFAEEMSEGGATNQLNTTYLAEALGGVDNPATAYSAARDGFFNPFGSGGANSAAVLDFISQGYDLSRYESRVSTANILAEGPIFALPGGDVRLAVGGQVRRETFERRSEAFRSGLAPAITVADPQTRDIAAVFAEVRIPVFGPDNARPGLERLDITLAGRAEDYDDVGSTANPKVGIVWSPVTPLKIRATWSTAFRAPALSEVFDRVNIGPLTVSEPGASRLAILQTGGNTDLDPETAESFTAGFDLTPANGFRFSASYFDTRFEDKIGRPAVENITAILVDPSLSPFVTRVNPAVAADLARIQTLISDPRFSAPGLFPASAYSVILDGRWANTGELHVRGLDVSASQSLTFGSHSVDLAASASYLFEYSRLLTPVASREALLGVVGFPVDLRLQASALWSWADWSARLGVNHVADYRDVAGRAIQAWSTVDGQVRWSPDARWGLNGLDVSVTVQNLFDEDPPFYDSPQGFGFDPGQAGPLGRTVVLQLTKRW